MKLTVMLEPSEEGGFTVLVPALPGCISEGILPFPDVLARGVPAKRH